VQAALATFDFFCFICGDKASLYFRKYKAEKSKWIFHRKLTRNSCNVHDFLAAKNTVQLYLILLGGLAALAWLPWLGCLVATHTSCSVAA
jgi:hypothetical protein